MRHPKDRQERRSVRDFIIQRRKKEAQTFGSWCLSLYDRDEIPYEHANGRQGPRAVWNHGGHGMYSRYQKYIEWQTLTEEEKRIRRVEAVLDGEDPKDAEPKYEFTCWSKYANQSYFHSGRVDWSERKEKRKMREERKKLMLEGLKDWLCSSAG